ncbi:isoleucine--tRNA ligase [Candidatus Woesearchaeota archaeon]|nr:isoleucine--tRNA ligase [Candidatus Woesearchaeota archaeon]
MSNLKDLERKGQIKDYNAIELESNVLDFWGKSKIYENLKVRNQKGKKFFFIQGPPYTSGRLHCGHAWNNSLKDMILRYKRMNKFNVFDRAAYDMHGLPTERKVMELYKLNWKEDIEKFGVEKFTKECLKWSVEKAELMSNDLWKLGIWMDFKNPAYPISNEYINGEWFLIKKAYASKRLYEGLRTLSWCPVCQTALAKHECDYKLVSEPSVFVKFPVKGKENEFLIVWTTTPWTIAYNLAIMVNPELEYIEAQVNDEIWIVAKGLAAPIIQAVADKSFKIIEEFKGEELNGLEYAHPWQDKIKEFKILKEKHSRVHTVILSEEYVDLSAGSGLVHCAPGCGPEDYEVGYKNDIPPFNNLLENGLFPKEMGVFAGLRAKKDDSKFIEEMKKDGMLIAITKIEHDYPHCERCRSPVVFRATKQWFFKVEDLKYRMVKANESVEWVPDSGKNAFKSWLNNLRDNSITKQRYWGAPVPIWKCSKCNYYEVIGGVKELEKRAGKLPENLHKPWIDQIEFDCPKCKSMMKRVLDVLDVWIDAGTLSWNILDYPGKKKLFDELYPADFILEAKEQIRGWFNLLTVSSFIAFNKPSFKACYMHGMLTDVDGVKMSKSLGNVISPYEIVDKYGADVLRYYMCQTTAGEDIKFSWEEVKLKHRNLIVLWNLHKFLIDYSRSSGVKLKSYKIIKKNLTEVEKYILSRKESTVKKVTELYENYKLDETIAPIEELFLELSRTYIQLIREKSVFGSDEEKEVVLYTLFEVLLKVITLFSTICPFITEAIYLNLKQEFKLKEESIHYLHWPKTDATQINQKLEEQFDELKRIIQSVLFAREKAQLGVRWSILEVLVISSESKVRTAVDGLKELLKVQTNVKRIIIRDKFDRVEEEAKINASVIGKTFGSDSKFIIAELNSYNKDKILDCARHAIKYETFKLKLNKKDYLLNKESFIFEKKVPEEYIENEFKNGFIYLNKTRNEELDAEGYSREIARKVQSMRKDKGLIKTDRIELEIKLSPKLKKMISDRKDNLKMIKEKVGAKELLIVENIGIKSSKKYSYSESDKVKSESIEILFNKI